MLKCFLNVTVACLTALSVTAHAGVVIESTRYLYKEGSREISAQIENKDDIPYLVKSWIEAPSGQPPYFMATPPLFRLEAKQKNTVRLFATADLKAPADRESTYFFNMMAIPPSDSTYVNNNTVQLAVRHRMRLVYRPKALQDKSVNVEANSLEWKQVGNKLVIKNPTPFFFYFNSVKVNDKEIKSEINSISPFSNKEVTLQSPIKISKVTWKIVNDYGGAGTLYSVSL